MPSRQNRFD